MRRYGRVLSWAMMPAKGGGGAAAHGADAIYGLVTNALRRLAFVLRIAQRSRGKIVDTDAFRGRPRRYQRVLDAAQERGHRLIPDDFDIPILRLRPDRHEAPCAHGSILVQHADELTEVDLDRDAGGMLEPLEDTRPFYVAPFPPGQWPPWEVSNFLFQARGGE